MSWITLSILAAIVWAVVNVIDKFSISKLVDRPVIPVIVWCTINGSAGLIIFAVVGFQMLPLNNVLLTLLASALYVLMAWLYTHALKQEEVSRVVPLFYLTPIFTLLLARFFLGETFPAAIYSGILLLICGAILISTRLPLQLHLGKILWLMLLSSVLLGGHYVITKYLLGVADFWQIFAYMRVGMFIVFIPAVIANIQHMKRVYTQQGIKPFAVISFSETLNLTGVLFITMATAVGFVTLVNALSSVQPFFVLGITIVLSLFYPQILQEKLGTAIIALKCLAIAMMFTGALIVSS